MQYQVPQFIEVEDKIFGPFTFRQFVYIAGGGAMCFLAYRFILLPFSLLVIVPIGGLSYALAFYKVNNRPFIDIAESAIKYALSSKLYIWKKIDKPATKEDIVPSSPNLMFVPKLSQSKLRDLTWSLDINETPYSKGQGTKLAPGDELETFKGLPRFLEKDQYNRG